MIYKSRKPGITVIEVLITLSIVALISAAGVFSYGQSRKQATIAGEGDTLIQIVREVQNRSQVANYGRAWGVFCSQNSYTTFSFTADEPELNPETFSLAPEFSCSTSADAIRFEKLTGIPELAQSNLSLQFRGEAVMRIEVASPGTLTLITL